MDNKIKSFTDLIAWRKGHLLVIDIYKLIKKFPNEEKFGLNSQMSRAVVSVTSNIAEGFSRRTTKDKINFYYHSLGSLTELQNQLLIARDINYINNKDFMTIATKTVEIQKLLHGLIKFCKK